MLYSLFFVAIHHNTNKEMFKRSSSYLGYTSTDGYECGVDLTTTDDDYYYQDNDEEELPMGLEVDIDEGSVIFVDTCCPPLVV